MVKSAQHSKNEGSLPRRRYDIIELTLENDADGVLEAIRSEPECINDVHPLYGSSALHITAAEGLRDIAYILLNHPSIDLGIRDNFDRLARDVALEAGHHHILDKIIKRTYPDESFDIS
jgi:ankyrin repeat protein